MSKITFRADDELVEEVERLDTSKSEVMREALRTYLDGQDEPDAEERTLADPEARSLDNLVADRVDELVADRIDELVDQRFTERRSTEPPSSGRDVNVNISLDPSQATTGSAAVQRDAARTPGQGQGREPPGNGRTERGGRVEQPDRAEPGREAGRESSRHDGRRSTDTEPRQDQEPKRKQDRTCAQCGDSLSDDHVYCPNCGQKATQRVFCECGDEVRTDWAFCPHCGRRTASADVLEK